jgi:hypothetical protein
MQARRIHDAATALGIARADLWAAVARRSIDPAAWAGAADRFRAAVDDLYDDRLMSVVAEIRAGRRDSIDLAITFLEVDPWCYRSGYLKQSILRALSRAPLPDGQASRCRAVVLRCVDVGDRREFRDVCRLAKVVVDPGLTASLLDRFRSADEGRARRALWMLDALGWTPEAADVSATLAVLEAQARRPDWYRAERWVHPLTRRYGTAEWFDRLLDSACSWSPDMEPALRLLGAIDVRPTPTQRDALATIVMHSIRTGRLMDSLEWAAVQADSPQLRADLLEAYGVATVGEPSLHDWFGVVDGWMARSEAHLSELANDGGSSLPAMPDLPPMPEPDERTRCWWAMNAIRRFRDPSWPGDLLE